MFDASGDAVYEALLAGNFKQAADFIAAGHKISVQMYGRVAWHDHAPTFDFLFKLDPQIDRRKQILELVVIQGGLECLKLFADYKIPFTPDLLALTPLKNAAAVQAYLQKCLTSIESSQSLNAPSISTQHN